MGKRFVSFFRSMQAQTGTVCCIHPFHFKAIGDYLEKKNNVCVYAIKRNNHHGVNIVIKTLILQATGHVLPANAANDQFSRYWYFSKKSFESEAR